MSELLHDKLTRAQSHHAIGSGIFDASNVCLTRDEFLTLMIPNGGTELTDLLRRVFYSPNVTLSVTASHGHDIITSNTTSNINTSNNTMIAGNYHYICVHLHMYVIKYL